MNSTGRPIGIFDSGIGGLSVLRHIREQLPAENLLYFADSGFAPYGGKPEEFVIRRTMDIAALLLDHDCKALVVACNTATAAAVHLLREKFPHIPIVGIEPGLKPATGLTKTRTVGVLATERTLASSKFRNLHRQLSDETGVHFAVQACPGLVELVEKSGNHPEEAAKLLRHYTLPLLEQKADTIVLGCTHYPFLQPALQEVLSASGNGHISIIDTGIAVTRQLSKLLEQNGLKRPDNLPPSEVHALTTGDPARLAQQFEQLLGIYPEIDGIVS